MSILKERHYKDDLTGKQFGELTVLEPDNSKVWHSKHWLCKCSCGKVVSVERKHLLDGSTKSCGHTKRQNGLDHTDNFNGMRDRQNKYNTNLEVIRNQKMQPNNTSGVKGVDYHKGRDEWRARVHTGGKEITKWFKDKEDAIKWREQAVDKYYKPKIDSAIKAGDLKEALSKYDDKETLFKALPLLLYHATLKEYLPDILKNGLKDFWVGQDVEECIEYAKMHHDCEYDDIVCIEIPKGALSADNCDFTEDVGDGWSNDWSGTFIYNGNISVETFDSYWEDDHKWYRLSVNMLEAYHYGNLDYGKKAETRNQFGTKRGTGHFGTGFYTVGKYEPEKVPSPYNTRACWEIDLDKYNLFKPKSNSEAHNLHDALKYINEYVDRNSFVNYDEQKLLQELDDLEYYRDNQGIIDFIKKYDGASLDEDNNPNYNLIHDIENNKWGAVDNYARELCKDMASSSDYLDYAVDILNRIFKLDREELKELVRDAYFNKSTDSVSTNFMKALGYEGVDVSHLDHDADGLAGLDNFSYGSVVYDLKPNTYRKVK